MGVVANTIHPGGVVMASWSSTTSRIKSTLSFLISAVWVAVILSYAISCFGHGVASTTQRSNESPLRGQRQSLRSPSVANQTNVDSNHRSLYDIQLAKTTYKIAHALEQNLLDWENYPSGGPGKEDLPVFWHILKSGGTTIKLMYAQCYHLVEACESGVLIDGDNGQQQQPPPQPQQELPQTSDIQNYPQPWEWLQQQQQEQLNDENSTRRLQSTDDNLQVVISEDGRKYVNVDVTTPEGIIQASQRGFASSNLADVVFTPLLIESAESLLGGADDNSRKGRMFAVFRHPVERVTSIFYYLQSATWEPTYNPEYAQWTIHDYARSPYCESNWMVRSLINKMTGPLSPGDFEIAQEVLSKKCLVGLLEEMEESIVRFHSYFGFGNEDALKCSLDNFARKGSGQNSHSHTKVDPQSETWEILEGKNSLDIRLFKYAQELFEDQGKWLKKEKLI